jgi:group II intron reverse transcriptase/maturase
LIHASEAAEDKGIAVRLATPEVIRTLQRKLYCKAKREPAFRFYALYDKVYRADILEFAYELVRANRGSPGVDGQTFERIEANEGRAGFLAELAEELKSKRYKPEPVKRVLIPKADGRLRPLGIPTIGDRVAQMAVKLVIEPIFEADFCAHSYGFRPRRGAHEAADAVCEALAWGHTQVIDADLSQYFDTIPHARLLKVLASRIADGAILHLIKLWLKAPVVDEGGRSGGGKANSRGTPQGGVISPLLANVYLHLLDRVWERRGLERRWGARLVRYADDFVVLCRRGTERAMALIQDVLQRLGLSLNETKTKVLDARAESFTFLGFAIRLRRGRQSGRFYPHVEPSGKALLKLRASLSELTARRNTPVPLGLIVQRMNGLLRGWVNYFHYRNCSTAMCRLKWHVEERLRTHLRKRHRVKNRAMGYRRFSSRLLYRKYRLYRVPTTAGWTAAHALR